MCIVVEEADVYATNIFVAPDTKKERQIVVYSNTVDTSFEKNLMVLAVPNPETVDFVDLSEYPEFFEDISKYFKRHEVRTRSVYKSYGSNGSESFDCDEPHVHEVGNFLASICKKISDLKKINSNTFGKIGDDALEFITSKYSNTGHGFVVCKLKKGNNNYHPFAYTHKISSKLFVPTMHYHGDEKKRTEQELKKRKEYNENGIKNELKSFEFFKKVNGTFFSDDEYKKKLNNILNKYKNDEIDLRYEWGHNIFIVNNEHDNNYVKKLDRQMFKKKVNFDIGNINAISKITKIGSFLNGDTLIDVKN